jgi:hypothetical protein
LAQAPEEQGDWKRVAAAAAVIGAVSTPPSALSAFDFQPPVPRLFDRTFQEASDLWIVEVDLCT